MTLAIERIEEGKTGQQRVLPHDGTCSGELRYGRINDHQTFSPQGELITVASIYGFVCVTCGLVLLTKETSDQLYDQIDALIRGRI